ncbi:MAG: hypothetical protein LLF28_00550 [Nitrospiraceae bacterium]|nr:hypothetical protein [Nitrospiraceae bacterium]
MVILSIYINELQVACAGSIPTRSRQKLKMPDSHGHKKKDASQIKEIRALAKEFTPEQIESCITQQIAEGKNVCLIHDSHDHVVNILSKASFVKSQMHKGVSMIDAIRQLADRIRKVQKGFK